jgi:hypothetical protein
MASVRSVFRHLSQGCAVTFAFALCTVVHAQTPEWNTQAEFKHLDTSAGKKLVLAGANMRVGVSLERLTLLSGEGNTDKKLMGGAMALVANLAGVRGDFAQREPIEEHLTQGDAEKVAQEAVELLLERLKSAGLEVEGPQAVVAAPFYANSKGDDKTSVTSESQNGGLFKKAYYYGIYKTAIMGMKYRDNTGFSALNRDTETFTKAREVTGASSAVELNMALINDKTNFALLGLSATLWGRYKDTTNEFPAFTATLKNAGDFKVASGGKVASGPI